MCNKCEKNVGLKRIVKPQATTTTANDDQTFTKEECKQSQLLSEGGEGQEEDQQQKDACEEGGQTEYLYLDHKEVAVLRLSGLTKDLYMKMPDGTRSKRNGGKVEMSDTEMLQMVEQNKRGLESGRFDKSELKEITEVIGKAKKVQM